MGLQETDGAYLTYKQSKAYLKSLQIVSLTKLVEIIKKFKDVKTEYAKGYSMFGYEAEGHMLKQVSPNDKYPDYQLDFDKSHMMTQIKDKFEIMDEAGKWMIEFVPSKPFDDYLDPRNLYESLKDLYNIVNHSNKLDKQVLFSVIPPKLGTLSYPRHIDASISTLIDLEQANSISMSTCVHDAMTNNHQRY